MKLQLLIEADANTIAAVLAILPTGVSVTSPSAPTISNVISPALAAPGIPPMPTAAQLQDADDDDNGPADPGAPALDSAGFPHDERIHAKSKGTIANGTWRKAKGIDPNLVAAVEAELRASYPAPAAPVATPAPVVTPPPVMPPPLAAAPPAVAPVMAPPPLAPAMPAPVAQPAPPVMPAPVVAPAPAPVMPTAEQLAQAAGATVPMDFANFMAHISGQMEKRDAAGAPLIHADYLAGVTAEMAGAFQQQLNAITDIQGNQQMVDYAVQIIQRDGRW